MSEGVEESLLSHTDAEVLGKPMAHLSKVDILFTEYLGIFILWVPAPWDGHLSA